LYYGYGGGETGSMSFADHPYESYGQQQAGQESGYTFGQGQSAPISITKNSEIPGAGGGWYGGYTVSSMVESIYAHAGGGSGHINTTLITNGATIAGDQTFPSPSGGTETGHTGNGYCIITWQQLP
ncbi:glycine rich domain-containing protein, partial [Segatella albensis]|uniref:glycine rich domain-containing protein n=1 Tax=Segatella albensis TaxID=77768 RepID=UPI000563DC9E